MKQKLIQTVVTDMLSIEHRLMQIPLQKIPAEFKEFHTTFDIMTKYQHYGMCTRLLDLTTNPLVALYFACKCHGEESYIGDDGEEKHEPYGVIYYTRNYYPSLPTDLEIQIVSALANYDLSKENTVANVLARLKRDHIIDEETRKKWSTQNGFQEFAKIIQENYMVTPTYTNERLRKQSGVFLLASLFSVSGVTDIAKSAISKSRGDLRNAFEKEFFFIRGENKEEKLLAMTEEDFLEYISRLWAVLMWGNKKYVVDKLIEDNGFSTLKKQLADLLYGSASVEKRWDIFLKSVKGMGPATISELLSYMNPQEYIVFNKTTILCYGYLGIPNMPKYNYQYTGKKYTEVCAVAKEIASSLKKAGAADSDLLAVDYFLWDEILPLAEKDVPTTDAISISQEPVSARDSRSLHDEIKDKLVDIGKLLGFDSRSEVKIATGAVVDAVWEAKIGNMGKAIYVFEVQSKGSIDSLILNLKKAQSNAAVQAVVAVADEEQLAKIIQESAGVIDEKSLRTWDSEDVLAVYDALVRAHESINKLALVPESF